MFLKRKQLDSVVKQAFKLCAGNAAVVIELADVKSSLYHGEQLNEILDNAELIANTYGFSVERWSKFKFLATSLD
jgi:hypothetical protein